MESKSFHCQYIPSSSATAGTEAILPPKGTSTVSTVTPSFTNVTPMLRKKSGVSGRAAKSP